MQTQDKATAREVLKEFDREGVQKLLNATQQYGACSVSALLAEMEQHEFHEEPEEVDWIRAFAALGALHHLKAIEANAE